MKPSGQRRVIRLFPDYGHEWPLWDNSTPERPSNYTMKPEDYGLSDALTAQLAAWYELWEAHCSENGWDDPAHEAQWRRDGRAIAAQLQREVADFADVSYEP
jgi:hypothetical protein